MKLSHLVELLWAGLVAALSLALAYAASSAFGWPVERGLLVELIGLVVSGRNVNGMKSNGNSGGS